MVEKLVRSNNPNNSDLIFINTCSIRERAEEKSSLPAWSWFKKKKNNPKIIIGVLGCMAQNLKQEILENKPYVDIILGPDSYRKLPKNYKEVLKRRANIVDTKLSRYEVYEGLFPKRKEGIKPGFR